MSKEFKILLVICVCIFIAQCTKNPKSPIENKVILSPKDSSNSIIIPPADDSAIPDSIKDLYKIDAARLALRQIYEEKNADTANVELPDDLVKNYYYALIHIHNATDLAARDSVINLYPIHTFPEPELWVLLIRIDPTQQQQEWFIAWKSGIRPCGNPKIDWLMDNYDLELENLEFGGWVLLRADRPLNILALANLFLKIDGVANAEPDAWGGGGMDLTSANQGATLQFDYMWGWGDCPSGCIYSHSWRFLVHSNGEVEFNTSWGAHVPPPRSHE